MGSSPVSLKCENFEYMLELIFILPLIGIFFLLITPRENIVRLWKIGLEWSLLTLTVTIFLWASFDGEGQFQAIKKLDWIFSIEPVFGVLNFAVDGISIFFIVLTALLTSVCILISWNTIKLLVKEFILCLLLMEVLLMGVFTILDIVGFYILFEGILIPMFLIIGIWGTREEKIQASYYFFFILLLAQFLCYWLYFYYIVTQELLIIRLYAVLNLKASYNIFFF